jgi:hypothetical protein
MTNNKILLLLVYTGSKPNADYEKIWTQFFPPGVTAPSRPGRPHHRGFNITLLYTPNSVGLLWTSDQPDPESSTWQHATLTRARCPSPPSWIRTHNRSKRAASDPRFRPSGKWDRMGTQNVIKNHQNSIYQFHNKEKLLAETQRSAKHSLHSTRQALMEHFIWCLG